MRSAFNDFNVTDREMVIAAKVRAKMFVVNSTGMLIAALFLSGMVIVPFFLLGLSFVSMFVLGKSRQNRRE